MKLTRAERSEYEDLTMKLDNLSMRLQEWEGRTENPSSREIEGWELREKLIKTKELHMNRLSALRGNNH